MTALLIFVIANAAYLAAFPDANLFYVANILLHPVLGLLLLWQFRRSAKVSPLLVGAAIGLYLIAGGATTDHYKIVWAHIALAVVGLALLKPRWTVVLAGLALAAAGLRFGLPQDRIANPKIVPLAMT